MNRATEIALHYKGRQSAVETIANVLKQTPQHIIDNVIIEALSSVKADSRVLSEIINKAREKIKENPTRYVLVHKDIL